MNNQFKKQLCELLAECSGYSLQDVGGATLMNRVDTKFVVPTDLIAPLLQSLQNDFRVLEINGDRCFQYENIYYDTSDFQFYQKHHQGKLNRHKVRVRRYIDSNIQFLEVKHKNNKKRTDKKRIEIDYDYDTSLNTYRGFLSESGICSSMHLIPSQRCTYTRVALVSTAEQDRLTIDLNVNTNLLTDPRAKVRELGDVAIIELKQGKINRHSPVFNFMRSHGIRPASISKYCMGFMGASQEHHPIKFNRFKKIAHRVEKTKTLEV
jgi:hypothetical protein